jgi:hypothetical protein
MVNTNGFREKLDLALANAETPEWVKPILLCMRDDHDALERHLAAAESSRLSWSKVAWSIIEKIMLVIVGWFLAGQFPQIWH